MIPTSQREVFPDWRDCSPQTPNKFSPKTPPSSSRSKSRSNRFTSDTVAYVFQLGENTGVWRLMGNGWPRCSVLIFVGRKDNNIRVVIFVGCVHVCVCVCFLVFCLYLFCQQHFGDAWWWRIETYEHENDFKVWENKGSNLNWGQLLDIWYYILIRTKQ